MSDEPAFTSKAAELHRRLLDDYFNEGTSLNILEAKYGRSKMAIGRLIKVEEKKGRTRLKQPADRRSVLTSSPLTRVHKRIGMRFIRWRTLENNYSMPEGAEKLGMTVNRLHSIEGGLYNWTLLELVYICERLNWTLVDLLRGADLGDYLVPDAA